MRYSYTKIPKQYLEKAKLLEEFHSGDLCWDREIAKGLLQALKFTTLKVVGGDVWYERGGHLELTYDNWYCEREAEESDEVFQQRCIRKALDYIQKYKDPPQTKVYFALVISEL